ncbi:MAG: flagellar biosynthetic protein FliO [Lysobacteraceae bacterium]
MHAASDIALGVVLAPATAAGALQASVPPAEPTSAGTTAAPAPAAPPADAGPAPAASATATPADAATTTSPMPSAAPFVPAPAHHASVQAATPPAFGQAPSAAGAVGGTVFALLFVVGLILALAWLARRMPGVAGGSSRALRVVASLSLGPREKVVVVDVGGQQLLLATGAGGTRALHALAVPLPDAERAAAPAFAQLLAQHFGKKA